MAVLQKELTVSRFAYQKKNFDFDINFVETDIVNLKYPCYSGIRIFSKGERKP